MKSALGENPKRVYGDKKVLPSTRLGVATIIREALNGAREYAAARSRDEKTRRDLAKEPLARVLSGEIPWCQHCHRVDDIATAIRLADEFGYRLVINHGTEAHLIASYIAERRRVSGRHRSAVHDPLQGRAAAPLPGEPGPSGPAGIKVAVTTDHPVVPDRVPDLSGRRSPSRRVSTATRR